MSSIGKKVPIWNCQQEYWNNYKVSGHFLFHVNVKTVSLHIHHTVYYLK